MYVTVQKGLVDGVPEAEFTEAVNRIYDNEGRAAAFQEVYDDNRVLERIAIFMKFVQSEEARNSYTYREMRQWPQVEKIMFGHVGTWKRWQNSFERQYQVHVYRTTSKCVRYGSIPTSIFPFPLIHPLFASLCLFSGTDPRSYFRRRACSRRGDCAVDQRNARLGQN